MIKKRPGTLEFQSQWKNEIWFLAEPCPLHPIFPLLWNYQDYSYDRHMTINSDKLSSVGQYFKLR